MHTLSAVPGTPWSQFAASVQLPPAVFVHVSVHATAVAWAAGRTSTVATSRSVLTMATPGIDTRRRRRGAFECVEGSSGCIVGDSLGVMRGEVGAGGEHAGRGEVRRAAYD